MLTTRPAVAAALAAVSLSLAACGGGSDTLSKSELVSQATTICKDVEAKVKKVQEPSGADIKAFASYFGKLAPYTEELESRLKELKPGDSEKADWDQLTSSVGKASDAFKNIASKAASGDQAGLASAGSELDKVSSGSDAAAKKLGLDGCD